METKTQTITESNRLIAEFMKVEPKLIGMYYYYDDGVFFRMREKNYEKAKQHIAEYVKYHSSWDWLMPVIKKIDSYANEKMDFAEFDDYRNNWRMIDNPSKYEIHRVFKQVVQFIQWYNEQKQ